MNPILKYGAPLVIAIFLGVITVSFAGLIVGLFIGCGLVWWDLSDERKKAQAKKETEDRARREAKWKRRKEELDEMIRSRREEIRSRRDEATNPIG